ncbi:COG3616 Predicted amino acid aldolase or racemase [Sphingomonadaceae bacterium]
MSEAQTIEAAKPEHAGVRRLSDLQTPCLVLDVDRMDRNIARLRAKLDGLGVTLRPHLKTAKSVEIARRMMNTPQGPATVSTLREAELFAEAGITDVIYAVGVTPSKLAKVIELRRGGCDLAVLLDTVEQAQAVASASREAGIIIPALIEIDCDGHRSGILPGDADRLRAIAAALVDGGELRGVLTHAGGSYSARGNKLKDCADTERKAVIEAATILRKAGYACPIVSMGSTPTAHNAVVLDGVTEVRAGVFIFFDLVMAGIGICKVEDIAISVLATVIGHQREKGWVLIDAGWMAMSQDRGTSKQEVNQGYGLVCDVSGQPFDNLILADANQEHGIITVRPGSDAGLPALQIGDRVRILPNHACATGAQHQAYHVVRGACDLVEGEWQRFGGW